MLACGRLAGHLDKRPSRGPGWRDVFTRIDFKSFARGGQPVVSRFLPGLRLLLYVLAGLVRLPGSVFATWALLGTLLWTPALVLLTATAGDAFVARMSPVLGSGVTTVTAAAVMVLLLHGIRLNTRSGGMC